MKGKLSRSYIYFEKRDKYFICHIALLLFYILSFWVITRSSFAADDMLNANAKALDYYPGDSVFSLTWRQFIIWFERGRLFPFSNYCYILFAYIPSRFAYKFLILVTIYLNNLLFGKCVEKVSKSKAFGLLAMLIFPICIQLTPVFNSALYCYHMLIQSTIMWMLASTLCVMKYIDVKESKPHRRSNICYLLAGSLFLLISLGTYETGFVIVSFMGLVIWAYTSDIKKTLKVLIPNIVVYILMIIANVVLRMNVTDSYSGVEMSFDKTYIVGAYLKQLYSTFPLARYIYVTLTEGGMPYTFSQLFDALRWYDVVMVILFVIPMIILVDRIIKGKEKINNLLFLFLSGASLMIFPPVLIALSSRYQKELVWGIAHISGYVQSFGLVLVILSLCVILLRKKKQTTCKIVVMILIILCIPIMLVQEAEARIAIIPQLQWFQYPRDNIRAAGDAGLFDEIKSDGILLPLADHYFEYAESDIFYTYAAKKPINTMIKATLIDQLKLKYGDSNQYNLKTYREKYYGIVSGVDEHLGYAILGTCSSIVANEDKALEEVMVDSALIFISGQSEFTFNYYDGNQLKSINSEILEIVKQTSKGNIYRINNLEFNILSAMVQ